MNNAITWGGASGLIPTQNETEYNFEQISKRSKITGQAPEPQPILFVHDAQGKKMVMSRGSISMIKGQMKSGKGQLLTLILSSIGRVLSGTIEGCFKSMVVFDTEQSYYYSTRSFLRAAELAGYFDQFSLMRYTYDIRKKFIFDYIQKYTPDVAFIDHIVDTTENQNDLIESKQLLYEYMTLAEKANCHICCTIHENHGSNKGTGHTGSELGKKVENILQVSLDDETFTVKNEYSRNWKFQDFKFYYDQSAQRPCISMDGAFTVQKAPY